MTITFTLNSNELDYLKIIKKKYVDRGMTYGYKANINNKDDQGHWSNYILVNSKYFPYDHALMPYIQRHKELNSIWEVIQGVIGHRALLRAYINGYTYGTDGYSHTDDSWINKIHGNDKLSETVIVYLNDNWNIDWAGETVIFDDSKEIEASVLPKYGRVLVFDSNKLHAARPLSRTCKSLRTVLVFKTIDPSICSNEVEFCLNTTSNLQHNGKTFFEHLFNTLILLEKNNSDKDLLLAGLFHSIYGTEYYKFESPYKNTDIIRNLIGEKADNLVTEFCALQNRYSALMNNQNNYSEDFLKDLIKIELANLIEQNGSGKYINQINALHSRLKKS